jgi:peptide/nickel transport system substrate-binding protein
MASVLIAVVLVACGAPAPTPQIVKEVVKETVVVTAKETVVVTAVVEKVVQQTVQVAVTATPAPKGGKVTMGTDKYPSGLDPHVQVAWDVLRLVGPVYDTLVWLDPKTNTFVPGLAESWTVSQDGLTYTFKLRKDVKFHDGTPFNAAAVKFNIDRIMAPETKSQAAKGLLGSLESATVVDDATVTLKLKTPFAFFLHGLSITYCGMVSPAAVQKYGAEYELHQVGTGPFMVKEYIPKDHMTLVRNKDYNWAPKIFEHQGPAYLEEIVWKFLPEEAARVPAMETGDVQLAFSIPPIDANRVQNDPKFSLQIQRLVGQPLYFFMNTQLAPTNDANLRKALEYAVDQQSILNAALRGLYTPATGPLSASTFEYTAKVKGMYTYDLAKAKTLLDQAGWKAGADGMRSKDGKPLQLLMSSQTWGFIPPIAQMLQGQLRQAGVDVVIEQMTYPAQMTAAQKGLKNLTVMGGSGFFAADSLAGFFHSKNAEAGFNWSKVKDPELDKLLDQGAQISDPAERKATYEKAQVMIMDQALIIPIYDYALLVGQDKRLQGLRWDVTGLTPWVYDAYMTK